MMRNSIIVNEREVGKTYYLFEKVQELHKKMNQIFIMDSATEHESKSLLKKAESAYKDVSVITLSDPNKIILQKVGYDFFRCNYRNFFPFSEIVNNIGNIICFDLSFFLEAGHDEYDKSGNIEVYKYYRGLYNWLAEQIAYSLILCEKNADIDSSCVIMDEIEFPNSSYNIASEQENLCFLGAVHPENAFGTFYKSFSAVNFKPYVRRKDRNEY